MELKDGYKRTYAGVIPEDWQLVCVKNIANITTGSKNTQDRIESGEYPFFVRSQTIERINSYSFDGEAVLTAGDGVGTGKVFHYINGKFDTHQRVYRITDFRERVNGYYFYLYFSSHFYNRIMQMTAKSSVDSVRMEMIADMLIPLPFTKAEQTAIAEALSDADALIESLEKLIAKKRNIKQGTMQQLLTGKKRLPGFMGKWATKKLGEIAEIKDGTHQTPKYVHSGIPFYSVENVTRNDFKDTKFISEEEHSFLTKAYKIEKGDILMTRIGSIGDCKYIDWDVVASFYVSLALLKIRKGCSAKFLSYYSNTAYFKNELDLNSLLSAIPKKINLGQIANVRLEIPKSFKEQIAIAQVLSDMDVEIEALEQKRDKYKDIKQGMMQELLTGRIRLIQQKEVGEPMTTAMKASETTEASPKKAHNWQINEAVVIAVLTGTFGSEQYPLGRKRYTKFSYLLHRHVESKAEGYRKKAAGPYNPDTKYKGPEKIAQDNRYIKHHATGKFSGFVADESIEQARKYFDKWYGGEVFQWLEQFRFESNEQLELLTTVDMAVCELAKNKQAVSVKGIKNVIRSHPEWKAKLNRPFFSDESIAAAIEKAQELFGV